MQCFLRRRRMNCLSGCIKSYETNENRVRKPINTAMLQPWVQVNITNGGQTISVSNISAVNTKASIKSFKYGISTGIGVTIEIIDEEGGNFARFLSRVSTGNLTNVSPTN